MKLKNLFACAFAVVVCSVTQASALYWQIDSDTGINYDYAQVVAYKNGAAEGALNVMNNGVSTGDSIVDPASGAVYLDLATYGSSEYAFGVELLDASLNVVGNSNQVTYQDLLAAGYISNSGLEAPAGGGFSYSAAGGGYSVPEPTSGVLLLIGGALLALRRRRV